MRIWFLVLTVLSCLHLFGQKQGPRVLKSEDLINSAMTKGIDVIKDVADPMNLLYMDSTLARKIVDVEFNSGFCRKYWHVRGIYVFREPEYTLQIARQFNEPYAAEKLYAYYCKLPKIIQSDTIYNIFGSSLVEMISVFERYRLKGLRERLKRDYYQWRNLAIKAPAKVYPVHNRKKKFNMADDMKFRKSDLYNDCNLIVYILANALYDLKQPGFDNRLIEQLKKKQTFPYLDILFEYAHFPLETYKSCLNRVVQTRQVPYDKIEQLVKDPKKIDDVLAAAFGDWKARICGNIIYCNKNTAWVEMSEPNGSDGYVLDLKNHQLKIFHLWSIIE